MGGNDASRAVIDKNRLPEAFPTHRLPVQFWEELGRVVGTYAALEEVLGKAILVLTGTRRVDEAEAAAALKAWRQTLEHALADPLGALIESFGKAVREHPDATLENLDDFLDELRKASRMRNALCHGSWQEPDANGRSKPLFVDRKLNVFDSPVDIAFLQQVQRHGAELVCEVMNTVTHMGYEFPGTHGPGKQVS